MRTAWSSPLADDLPAYVYDDHLMVNNAEQEAARKQQREAERNAKKG